MNRAAAIFATPWFHRRFTLAQDGQYTTVTEVADWARTPYAGGSNRAFPRQRKVP